MKSFLLTLNVISVFFELPFMILLDMWLNAYDKTSNRIKNPILCGLIHGLLNLLIVFFGPIMCWYYIRFNIIGFPEVDDINCSNWRYEERFQEYQESLKIPDHNWMKEGF